MNFSVFLFQISSNLSPVHLLKVGKKAQSIYFFSFKLESNDKAPDLFFLQNFNFLSNRTLWFISKNSICLAKFQFFVCLLSIYWKSLVHLLIYSSKFFLLSFLLLVKRTIFLVIFFQIFFVCLLSCFLPYFLNFSLFVCLLSSFFLPSFLPLVKRTIILVIFFQIFKASPQYRGKKLVEFLQIL